MSKKGGYVIVDLKGKTITAGTTLTLTADRSFRLQFDLLIDTANE